MASRAGRETFRYRPSPKPKLLHSVLDFLSQEPNQKDLADSANTPKPLNIAPYALFVIAIASRWTFLYV